MKPTPAPWKINTKEWLIYREGQTQDWCIAALQAPGTEAFVNLAVVEANARLIASAPALLEALREAEAALKMAALYLNNPEVQAIPFALHASVPAKRAEAAEVSARAAIRQATEG